MFISSTFFFCRALTCVTNPLVTQVMMKIPPFGDWNKTGNFCVPSFYIGRHRSFTVRAALQIESSQISLARQFALPISPPIKAPLMMLASHISEMLREWERVANVTCY